MKKEKCGACGGTGEVEILESGEEKFYSREKAKPLLEKAFDLPNWCWWKYDGERKTMVGHEFQK